MSPEHDKLIARIQYFYDFLQKQQEACEMEAVNQTYTEHGISERSRRDAYLSALSEYNKLFGEMLYKE
jgi:hypothetical protein